MPLCCCFFFFTKHSHVFCKIASMNDICAVFQRNFFQLSRVVFSVLNPCALRYYGLLLSHSANEITARLRVRVYLCGLTNSCRMTQARHQ